MFETLTWSIEAITIGFVVVVVGLVALKVAATAKELIREIVS